MASIINADDGVVSGVPGLRSTADSSGILQLQSNGTNALSINPNGKVIYPSTTLSTAAAGALEYDGKVPYFTPQSTERGLIPGMQYYALDSAVVGANSTATQSILGVGVTLSSNTVYAIEGNWNFFKNAGATSHVFRLLWGGTATLNKISCNVITQNSSAGYVTINSARAPLYFVIETASVTAITGSIASAFYTVNVYIKGIVSVNAGGTFIPQYSLSAAPGGAYTSSAGNYMAIYPISAAGSNTSVGTWA